MQDEATDDRYRMMVFEGHAGLAVSARPKRRSLGNRPTHGRQATRHSPLEAPAESVEFVRMILQRSDLDVRAYRLSPLMRRVPACLRALKARSIENAMQFINDDPSRLAAALDALLIGVTEFYRDAQVFDDLHRQVLPMLLKTRPGLDVHSVACSDGAEVYTMAVLLAELRVLHKSNLRGSDCRSSALTMARRARYAAASLEGLPKAFQRKYFRADGGCYTPTSELACAPIEWRKNNVIHLQEKERWDVILCRNVAIYLDSAATQSLWQRLAQALRPGGVLVVGKAEKPLSPVMRRLSQCVYIKEDYSAI
jgi:chemotaxis methyl-accepting protein methylase